MRKSRTELVEPSSNRPSRIVLTLFVPMVRFTGHTQYEWVWTNYLQKCFAHC